MEIAIGLMGLGFTTLGLVLGYMWKSNGYIQREIMSMQRETMNILERVEEGQRDVAQMLLNQTKILERIESKPQPWAKAL